MNRLKERRLELGLTQPQVSDHLKKTDPRIDVGMVSRFENGVCIPTPSVMTALCEIMKTNEGYLFGGEDVTVEAEEQMDIPEEVKLLKFIIPFGKDAAIDRETLARELGKSDRQARRCVEIARKNGVMIINDGKGYYQTNDIRDIARQCKKDEKRVITILQRIKQMRNILEDKT